MGRKRIGKGQRLELADKRFGRLTVLKILDDKKFRNWQWLCQCDCGNQAIVTATRLVSGNTQSCGCFRNECISKRRRVLRPYESSYKLLISDNAKRKAKFPVDLTYEEFVEFTKIKQCYYCHEEITWHEYRHKMNKNFGYNLDRLDSTKGYSKDNCVVCCSICNWMKWKLNYSIFIEKAVRIAKYHGV